MAGWLNRATEGFRRQKPVAPEPYEVECDCGTVVTGLRAANAQRPACSNCSRPVFVLPQNVYPGVVKQVRPSGVAGKPSKSAGRPESSSKSTGATADRKKPGSSAAPAEPPNGILAEARSPLVTPFRMVVFAIIAISGLTGWGLWHRSAVAAAIKNVGPAKEAGMAALTAGDFGTAARELKRARDAVNLLRRTDVESNLIRRFCHEAVAGSELCSVGLFDLLAEASTGPGKAKSLTPLRRAEWLLFDTVVRLPESSRQPCLLDLPIDIDGRKFRVMIDSASVRKAVERGGGTEGRVIFAAQPQEVVRDATEPAILVFNLNGQTAFLWSNIDTYGALGYRDGGSEELQQTRDTLARQLEQLEPKP